MSVKSICLGWLVAASFFTSGCGITSRLQHSPTEREWSKLHGVMLMDLWEAALPKDIEGLSSICIVPDPLPSQFLGYWLPSVMEQQRAQDRQNIEDWVDLLLDYFRQEDWEVPDRSLRTIDQMLDTQSAQQARRTNPEEPAVLVARLLDVDLVLGFSPRFTHAYDDFSGTTHSATLRYRIYQTDTGRLLKSNVVTADNALVGLSARRRSQVEMFIALDKGNPKRNMEVINRHLAAYPDDRMAQRSKAYQANRAGDVEQLTSAGESLREIDPKDPYGYLALAQANRHAGNLDEAIDRCSDALLRTRSKVTITRIHRELDAIQELEPPPELVQRISSLREGGVPGTRLAVRPIVVSGDTTKEVVARLWPSVVTVVTDMGTGTGMVVAEDNLLLTNEHVVRGAKVIRVRFYDGIELEVDEIIVSPDLDAALLRVRRRGMSPVRFGSSASPPVGLDVLAIGNALGMGQSVTKGIVSAVVDIDEVRYIQTDAAINFGNSGGPLVGPSGSVLGMNTLRISGEVGEGMGWAIAASELQRFIDRYVD